MGKAKQCFVYNTKIIETPTTKEVYFYETPIYSHSNSDSKTSNTQAHKRKVFDEMSAHKQYDSLKRKQNTMSKPVGRLPVLLTAILITRPNF